MLTFRRDLSRAAQLRRCAAIALVVAAGPVLLVAPPAGAFLIQEKGGPQSATNGIVLGPDGNFWVAEEFSSSVVRMTQAGVVLKRYAVGSRPSSVTTGPGGRVWIAVTAAKKLVWIDAASSEPSTHDVPVPGACGPVGLVAGNDGRMYFSMPAFGELVGDPCNSASDLLGTVADTGAGAVTVSPAGRGQAYDLEVAGGKLFVPDFSGGVVRRLSLGTAFAIESTVSVPTPGAGPDGITADGAGNIWFTEWNSGKVGRFEAAQNGGVAQEFTPAGGTLINPFGIVAGADGRIYVTGKSSANIARVSADGNSFQFYSLPDSEPLNIINGTDADLWFTDQKKTRILRLVNNAPRVSAGAAAATAPTSAAAKASVNPRGNETQVVFDYGPTTAYGSTSAPVIVPNGADAVEVTAVLSGLAPSTTYHVRARAANAEGAVVTDDSTFRTPAGVIDADRDGVSPPRDCNDANPAIRPGAVDVPADKIDQDCDGRDAPFPELVATTTFGFSFGGRLGRFTIVRRIDIARLRGGETATIRCTGRRCPFKVKTYHKLKRGKRVFGKALLRGRRLPAGTKISVRVTARGTIGTAATLMVRNRKRPLITRGCLRPGAKRVSRCP